MWFLAKSFTLSLEDGFFDKPKGGGRGNQIDSLIRFSFKLYDIFLVINGIYILVINSKSKNEH